MGIYENSRDVNVDIRGKLRCLKKSVVSLNFSKNYPNQVQNEITEYFTKKLDFSQ